MLIRLNGGRATQIAPRSVKELRSAVGQASPVVLRRASEVLRVVGEASEGAVRGMGVMSKA